MLILSTLDNLIEKINRDYAKPWFFINNNLRVPDEREELCRN